MADEIDGIPARYFDEPDIVINGVRLSVGQSLSTRVAVELYMLELEDEQFRKDMGRVGDNYQARLREVRTLMSKKE